MKRMSTIMALLACVIFAFAQNGRELDLKKITGGEYRPEGIRGVIPMADGETYSQISEDGKRIVKYSFKTGKEVGVLFDTTTARDCKFKTIDGYTMSPDEKNILIQTETQPVYRRSFTAVHYLYSVRNNKLEPLSDKGPQQVPLFSPDGNQIAFVRDNNIFLVKLLFNNSESQVTTDGKFNEVLNGIPDWVNEEEFGLSRAFDFSADSKMIAYVRYDETKVPMFSFMLYEGQFPTLKQYTDYPGTYSYKYPEAGMTNSTVTVHTYDIKSHVTRKMDLPLADDGYIPRIKFTKDTEKLAIMTLNRLQNRFDLYIANPRSTLCKMIYRDESEAYINESAYSNIEFYDNNFAVLSEKSGYNQLYWYTINGNLARRVTNGDYVVSRFLGWDKASDTFYYESNEGSPLRKAVYKVDAKGKKTNLTPGKGTNSAQFSSNLRYFINTFSNLTTPPVITLNNNDGKQLGTLVSNDKLKQKLAQLELPEKSFFSFKTSEGIELNGWMIKPAGFDAARKYPALMYQYSGPGSQEVLDKWGIGGDRLGIGWDAYMASKGYVVVCVDGRGTGGRGADFEKCIYLNLGIKESTDQVETARYLGGLPYIDKSRIGIWGWSFGGYTTIMSLSQGSNLFRTGIAVAAVTDWKYYDSVYTERYMRTPKENPEGYKNASAFTRSDKLHGKLLLVHGTADDNVHYQNCTEYSEQLVQGNKQFEMQIYTNRNHSIFGGNTRYHMFTRMTDFILNNL